MHYYWLLQVVYDSINFDSYFISVKGPLKNPEALFYSLLSLAIKICSLVQMCTIYLSMKVVFFKVKKNSAAHVHTSGGLRKWI